MVTYSDHKAVMYHAYSEFLLTNNSTFNRVSYETGRNYHVIKGTVLWSFYGHDITHKDISLLAGQREKDKGMVLFISKMPPKLNQDKRVLDTYRIICSDLTFRPRRI